MLKSAKLGPEKLLVVLDEWATVLFIRASRDTIFDLTKYTSKGVIGSKKVGIVS